MSVGLGLGLGSRSREYDESRCSNEADAMTSATFQASSRRRCRSRQASFYAALKRLGSCVPSWASFASASAATHGDESSPRRHQRKRRRLQQLDELCAIIALMVALTRSPQSAIARVLDTHVHADNQALSVNDSTSMSCGEHVAPAILPKVDRADTEAVSMSSQWLTRAVRLHTR